MKRRLFIRGLGSAVAWPVVARAQQAVVPVIGLLTGGARDLAAIMHDGAHFSGLLSECALLARPR
jgi:hypothetical protein